MYDAPARESFEVQELLGKGAFGTTYRCLVLNPDLVEEYGTDQVAIKVPHDHKRREFRDDFEMNALLYQKMRRACAPNICRYLGVEAFHNRLAMVMEYVPNGTLRSKIRRGRIPIMEAVQLTEGILDGIAIIHSHQIFHRDIKPENVLMEGSTPKVADLGLSRLLTADERASSNRGTLLYMSPEAFGKEGASFAADVWSTGVTLYEMLTGSFPFGEWDTPVGVQYDLVCRQPHAPACELKPDVPVALSEIIDRALVKDPTDRFSAAQMAEVLRRFRDEFETAPEREVEQEIARIVAAQLGPDEVESLLQSILHRFPSSPRANRELGEFYNRQQRYREAIETFERGIASAPKSAILHWDAGITFRSIGERDQSAAHLRKAVELGLDPSYRRYAEAILRTLESSKS